MALRCRECGGPTESTNGFCSADCFVEFVERLPRPTERIFVPTWFEDAWFELAEGEEEQ